MTLLTGIGLRAVLSLGYLIVLLRVRLGSKYGLVTLLVVLMLFNCIAGIALTYEFADFLFKGNRTDTMTWIISSLLCVKNITFNVAHWLLAWQYNKIADEVPAALERRIPEKGSIKCNLAVYWTAMALNLILPIGYLFAFALFYQAQFVQKTNPTPTLRWAYVVFNNLNTLLQVIYGSYLIWGVYKIRRYFHDKKAAD